MKTRRKRRERLSFQDKCILIENALTAEIVKRQLVGYSHHMFSMSQIASLTGYARSNRFLETLYRMVDDKKLKMKTQNDKRGVTDFNVWFTLPEHFKQMELIAS